MEDTNADQASAGGGGNDALVDTLQVSSLDALWQLIQAILHKPQVLWPTCAAGTLVQGRGQSPEELSCVHLRCSLATGLRKACARQHHAVDSCDRSAKALEVLLGEVGHDRIAAMCSSRSGVLLLKDLLEFSAPGSRRQCLAEQPLEALVEGVCSVVPSLHALDDAIGMPALVLGAKLDDRPLDHAADAVRQIDLRGMLLALAGQSSVAQRERIQSLVASFVSEVSLGMEDPS